MRTVGFIDISLCTPFPPQPPPRSILLSSPYPHSFLFGRFYMSKEQSSSLVPKEDHCQHLIPSDLRLGIASHQQWFTQTRLSTSQIVLKNLKVILLFESSYIQVIMPSISQLPTFDFPFFALQEVFSEVRLTECDIYKLAPTSFQETETEGKKEKSEMDQVGVWENRRKIHSLHDSIDLFSNTLPDLWRWIPDWTFFSHESVHRSWKQREREV